MDMVGNVDFCPVTTDTWEARAMLKQSDCGGQSVYHCLSDNKGRKWEKCVEKTQLIGGHCPIFTDDGYIDWKQCNTSMSTCPNSTYISDEVYKYPACFGNNTPSTHVVGDSNVPGASSPSVALIIGIAVLVLIIVSMALAAMIIVYRRRKSKSNCSENTDELQALIQEGINMPVVKMRYVLNGMAALSREGEKSIVVLGRFGNAVSSTSRRILESFAKQKEWTPMEFRYTDIPCTVEENTIMFVYGWFGFWNDDPCSIEKVRKACRELTQLVYGKPNVKVIIGMRSDHHKKYHVQIDEAIKDLFHNEINLDSEDMHKDAEHSKYFDENIKKACVKSESACKDLKFHTLRKGCDKAIGIPLKLNVLAKYHDLIHDYVANRDLLKAMTDHFTALENDTEKKHVYGWIMYICLKGKYARSENVDDALIQNMKFGITARSFEENYDELNRYVRMRNSDRLSNIPPQDAQYVFWHQFIYICAFHYMYKKDPDAVMSYCNIDAIVQLVRPEGVKKTYLEVSADSPRVARFNERMQQNGLVDEYKNHPLIKTTAEDAHMGFKQKDEISISMEGLHMIANLQILKMSSPNDK
ncbi:uncharacterized protein LOC125663875 [Ostrea edulis]|uniref:uncharacterized protein LOC125663875 n=1 Tax=Ostrea edulis TaxID=37623 RepID=UPI0024AEB85B|nr:uncharacterized protein LOC125663875 [Ostrea edulis]